MMASAANERGSYYPLCQKERRHPSSSGAIVSHLATCFKLSHLIQGWMIEQKLLSPGRLCGLFVLFRPFHQRHLTCLFPCHLLDLAAQERSSPSLCTSVCLTLEDEGVPRDAQLNLLPTASLALLLSKVEDTLQCGEVKKKVCGKESIHSWPIHWFISGCFSCFDPGP